MKIISQTLLQVNLLKCILLLIVSCPCVATPLCKTEKKVTKQAIKMACFRASWWFRQELNSRHMDFQSFHVEVIVYIIKIDNQCIPNWLF